MFNKEELPIEVLRNPLAIQQQVLTELQNRLLETGDTINDGNSAFVFLTEMASTLSSDSVNAVSGLFPALYPVRAQTSQDLFRHMSTWDYLNLYSTPSDCTITLFFDKDYLINNAAIFNTNYKKVVIPKNSVFTLAGYEFGLHYPIEIRINRDNDTFLVSYDLSESNPLSQLKQNTIEHTISQYGGLNLISLSVPIYQFTRQEIIEEMVPEIGFTKQYAHNDKFYAVRLYSYKNNDWVEIAQTLSDEVYNPRDVTAKLFVLDDISEVKINIPQIYFDNGKMGSKLKIEFYTTKGEVDIDIAGITQEEIDTKFISQGGTDNQFSQILNHIPTIGVSPKSSKIVGGANGYGFDELADRVINNTFYGNVLITNDELEKYFEDVGFKVFKYRDGITDRTYYCYKNLTDANGTIVGSGDLVTTVTANDIANCNTIVSGLDNSITILPTTLFKYDSDVALAKPVLDVDRSIIDAMSKVETIDEFNNNIYTFSPFHTRLDLDERFPLANTYDLMKPSVDKIEFIQENIKVISQLVMFKADITHVGNGAGGYDVNFYVQRSEDLKDVDMTKVKVLVKTTANTGGTIWLEAAYQSTTDNKDKFFFHIGTDYNITREHQLHVSSFEDNSGATSHFLPLITDLDVVFLLDKTIVTTPGAEFNNVGGMIPSAYNDYIAVSEQLVRLYFGQLVEVVTNDVDLIYSDEVLETYAMDVLAVQASDIYYRDANNAPEYHLDGGNVVLHVKFRQNDWVYHDQTINSQMYEITCTTVDGSNSVEITNPHNKTITVGMGITTPSLPIQCKVTAINGTTLTIDKVADSDATDAPGFVDDIELRYIAGDPVLDANGLPTIVSSREIHYHINIPQSDAKISESELSSDANYVETVAGLMRSYFNTIRTAKDQLIENTKVFYKPMRTLGNGKFKASASSIVYMDLELTFHFKVYVQNYVMQNRGMNTAIESTILAILDKHLAKNIISCSEIVKDIKLAMPESVESIDILGINDDINLQTLIVAEDGTNVSLARKLVMGEDNLIVTKRGLYVDFITV